MPANPRKLRFTSISFGVAVLLGTAVGVLAGNTVAYQYDNAGNLVAVVDVSSDLANCGDIGFACIAPANACCTGACADTTANPGNCGACGHGCTAPASATATCTASTCGFSCVSG